MLTCKEASRLLSQSMDQPLPHLKRLELRVHVWLCSACSNFEKQLLFLRRAAHQLDEGDSQTNQARLSSEARERIRKAVRQ
ncbi:zf-HC2 domain-containing protein [Methylocaldum sp.]|uniref:anti-sigma factor family protein n=1 Tax=Methylocaldum sp. TaxID=1969727 RepID=UPI002D7071C0|nr:zf-HC2 domain-containing protein [Methylocaldum sp.]HYE35686.1 zf-HC2 domain-containing protein [Methylocaldum sp.]